MSNNYRESGRTAAKIIVAARDTLFEMGQEETSGFLALWLGSLDNDGWAALAVKAGMERNVRWMEREIALGILATESEIVRGEA